MTKRIISFRINVLPPGLSRDNFLAVAIIEYEPSHKKTNNVVSDQVQHKLSCTSTEDGYRLENLDLERREIVLSV